MEQLMNDIQNMINDRVVDYLRAVAANQNIDEEALVSDWLASSSIDDIDIDRAEARVRSPALVSPASRQHAAPASSRASVSASNGDTCAAIVVRTKQRCSSKPVAGTQFCKRHTKTADSPVQAAAAPAAAPSGKQLCAAKAARTGNPCKRVAVDGTVYCRQHAGGAASPAVTAHDAVSERAESPSPQHDDSDEERVSSLLSPEIEQVSGAKPRRTKEPKRVASLMSPASNDADAGDSSSDDEPADIDALDALETRSAPAPASPAAAKYPDAIGLDQFDSMHF